MTTMMWLLVAVFAAVLVGGGLLARRREVRIREAHSAALECRDQELSQVREESTQRAESSNHQLTLVEQTAKAREQALSGYLAKALDYDLRSRHSILNACHSEQLDGVLLSNVVFLRKNRAVGGDLYRRQIDHVVVTSEKVLLLENKGWKGLVFDGVPPGTIHPDLGAVVGPLPSKDTFAVHIGGQDRSIRIAEEAPIDQAAKQARDLKNIAAESGVDAGFVEICVLYSHPQVRLHALSRQVSRGWHGRVIDLPQLDQVLRAGSGERRVDVEQLTGLLEPLAGDIAGFGSYESTWPSRLAPRVQVS
ncbi:NERD domain-containing protein [Nesterenkonia salmonea]|uniref:NERD domain-containing protein n=1 Tax=Nesterenkonia salmonea TaxID=1804987 RepID=A0A5R9BCS2_9MICC|nr:nuclease-related domain-containing protein [Nesterenkonia salmonea]TLP97439.1 NERD domain-containing protein [Nesterenkonia salmonea]